MNDPSRPPDPLADDAPSVVEVWHAAAATGVGGPLEQLCESLLSDDERRAADRFRRPTNRNQHVVGRGMAKHLLADGRCQPESVRFRIGPHGKPLLATSVAGNQPFNIAHTDGLVLCGIADDATHLLGVDVEATDRRTSTELAERYFAQPEIACLRRAPAESQASLFLKIWTLKEAYIKAIGTGMHTPLADFAFEAIDSAQPTIRFLAPAAWEDHCWQFFSFQPRPGYIASLAVAQRGHRRPVAWRCRSFEDRVAGGSRPAW